MLCACTGELHQAAVGGCEEAAIPLAHAGRVRADEKNLAAAEVQVCELVW